MHFRASAAGSVTEQDCAGALHVAPWQGTPCNSLTRHFTMNHGIPFHPLTHRSSQNPMGAVAVPLANGDHVLHEPWQIAQVAKKPVYLGPRLLNRNGFIHADAKFIRHADRLPLPPRRRANAKRFVEIGTASEAAPQQVS